MQLFPEIGYCIIRRVLTVLIRAGDADCVAAAKKMLTIGQTDRSIRAEHSDKGTLLLAPVEKGYGDSDVLKLADSWLRLVPENDEQALHAQLERAVKNAAPHACSTMTFR